MQIAGAATAIGEELGDPSPLYGVTSASPKATSPAWAGGRSEVCWGWGEAATLAFSDSAPRPFFIPVKYGEMASKREEGKQKARAL